MSMHSSLHPLNVIQVGALLESHPTLSKFTKSHTKQPVCVCVCVFLINQIIIIIVVVFQFCDFESLVIVF
jgi:hypothetical protein